LRFLKITGILEQWKLLALSRRCIGSSPGIILLTINPGLSAPGNRQKKENALKPADLIFLEGP
jgi:hypothetical protein